MNTCPNCAYEIEFVEGTAGPGKYTVCPQCAVALRGKEDGTLCQLKTKEYNELPEYKQKTLESLQRAVSTTERYGEWFKNALGGLVNGFVDGAMSKGLAREEVVPAVLTLFHMAIENMHMEDKVKWIVKLVESLGTVKIDIMKFEESLESAKDMN